MKAAAFSLTVVFLLTLGVLGSVQAQLTEGTDAFQSDATVELTTPDGTPETLVLSGPTLIKRGKPGDADEDGLADQPTEIIQLELRGTSAQLGQITFRAGAQHGLNPSLGGIEELQKGTTFPADSFFDVFARLDASGGPATDGQPIKGTNERPAHLAAIINTVPPLGTPYKEFNIIFVFVVRDQTITITVTKVIHIPREDPPVPQKQGVKKLSTTWGKLKSSYSK
jgi:hypothetical protein